MAQCTAKSKQSGVQCKRQSTQGFKVCRMHGGASLAGVASPNFKHGKYSKHLPPQLMKRYEAARDDPAILSLMDEIALFDARIVEVMEGLHTGGVGDIWNSLKKSHANFEAALAKGDWVAMQQAVVDQAVAIKNGASEQQRWSELSTAIFSRQRLVESERRRLQEMGQMVSLGELTGLFATLVQVLRDEINDNNVLNGVMHAINQKVFNRERNDGGVGSGSGDQRGRYLESGLEG